MSIDHIDIRGPTRSIQPSRTLYFPLYIIVVVSQINLCV
jgi:hypothetical protein